MYQWKEPFQESVVAAILGPHQRKGLKQKREYRTAQSKPKGVCSQKHSFWRSVGGSVMLLGANKASDLNCTPVYRMSVHCRHLGKLLEP